MDIFRSSLARAATGFKALALAGAMFAAHASAQSQDIKLGFVGDMTASPTAGVGIAGVAGIEAAIEDINKAGGLLGRKLSLIVRDDQGQPARSIQGVTELIDSEKVVALFGPSNSGNAMAWKRIPNEKKVPVMVVIAEATDVTKPMTPDGENYMFRDTMYDRAQTAALTAYAKKNGAKKVGLITETTGYGEGGLRDLQVQAKAAGLDVVAAEKIAVADTDMTSQLTKLKAAGVDTVLAWCQGTPMGLLLRSMEKLNYFPTLLSAGGATTNSFYDAAGPALASKAISVRTIWAPVTEPQQKLFKRVEGKLTNPVVFYGSVQAYDGVMLLAAAIRQAGSVEGLKVREALENLQAPVQGIFKSYDKPFSRANHEALVPSDARFVRWNNGKVGEYTDAVTKSLTAAELNR
ncbi:MAG TPA: ABC transporter substrate-binding protein [Ramlibacter sp.]|nr:ABC transporter substrate-binding protein [Ramlibacter sp.]